MVNGKKAILLILIIIIAAICIACGGSSGGSYINNDYNDYDIDNDETKDSETEDKASDYDGMADSVIKEVDIVNTLNSGVYAFYNAAENCYLSFNDRTLTLTAEPASWEVKASAYDGFYIYGSGTNLLLDIDNAYINEGTLIKLWENTGYNTQTWYIIDNGDSTYWIGSAVNGDYCIGFENGNAVLQIRDENNQSQKWIVTEMPKNYISVTSTNSIIELQMPLDITTVISETRLQQWANELEAAYYSFYELTGFIPYDTIIVEAYKPCEYTGYVTDNSNIIHIDSAFIYSDMEKMAVRESDWNFCALHEMGHMFDMKRPWKFEAEVMTDLKVAYVLETNGVSAVPSEFDASYSYYGADIVNAYEYLGSDFSQTYNVYECAARFLRIKEYIGWEPFKQTFHYLQENYDAYSALSGQEKFENFISLLTSYSGVNVAEYFSQDEWNCIISACNP